MLVFNVTVNLHVMRPTPPGFFQGSRASHQHFWIPCVFSSPRRRAFNVIVNLNDSRPTASTFFVFFIEYARRRNPATFLGFTFIVFPGTMRLGFTSHCEFTCDAASPCWMSFLFPRENAPRRNRREVSKSWSKGIC